MTGAFISDTEPRPAILLWAGPEANLGERPRAQPLLMVSARIAILGISHKTNAARNGFWITGPFSKLWVSVTPFQNCWICLQGLWVS